jgi:anti-sigma-K factor RskA
MRSGEPELPELHALTGAFVLDAVTSQERAEFDAHLRQCAQCQADVAELREAAARLATAQAVEPPPELRAAVLRAIRQTSQLAPPVAGQPGPVSPGPRGRVRNRLSRVLFAAAAALVIVAGVAVGTHYIDRSGQAGRPSALIETVLNAPDAIMRTAPVGTGGMAVVVTSHSKDMAVFMARGLRALPRTRRYEVWLMGPHGDRAAGLLTVRQHGMARPVLVGPMRRGDMVAVTVEPASGSLHPTSAPLVMIGPASR